MCGDEYKFFEFQLNGRSRLVSREISDVPADNRQIFSNQCAATDASLLVEASRIGIHIGIFDSCMFGYFVQQITVSPALRGTVQFLQGDDVGIQSFDDLCKFFHVAFVDFSRIITSFTIMGVVSEQSDCSRGFGIGLRFYREQCPGQNNGE